MLVLYHNDMSLCAQKARVCLAEKGLEWASRPLVLRAGEHQQSWYRKLNRRAVVPPAAVIGGARPASAQAYPTQTITFQVAFAAGGIADVVARLVGQKLSERLGYTVVVENRGGAGGNLAAKSVSAAAPDGHSVLVTTTSLAVNETATRNKGFSADDLRAIAIVAFSPDILAVHP